MSGRGEGDGRPHEGGPYQEGPYQEGTYQEGQYQAYGPVPQQGYPGQDAAGYGYDGQPQGQYGEQGYPGAYGGQAYDAQGYGAAPAPEAPGYGAPEYGTAYETPSSYETPSYENQAYGQTPYGYTPEQAPYPQPAPAPMHDSGAYGTVPQPGYGQGADHDSGAYAAYDGPVQPTTGSGERPPGGTAAAAAGAGTTGAARSTTPQAGSGVRRAGTTGPTGGSATTGSFRVQVPGARPGTPSRPAAPRPPAASPPRPAAPAGRPARPADSGTVPAPGGPRSGKSRRPGGRSGARTGADREKVGYGDDEFDFVDDDGEETEDVIDWLKFAETRSERRDERRRQLRSRLVSLVVVLALAALGAGGYYAYTTWWAEDSKAAATAPGGAVLIQLRGQGGEASASAVLADDPSRGTAAMITVPSSTVVNTPGAGPRGIGELMATDGAGATRDALAQLIGVKLDGSWVVSEPVLQGLVDMMGGVELAADVEVKSADGRVVLPAGPSKVDGVKAVAYATYRVQGEPPSLGAERFGRVVQAVLKVLPTESRLLGNLLRNLGNVPDPSLPDERLAEHLTSMATAVQAQQVKSADLPVQPDGVLDVEAAGPVVKELLGGTVQVAKAEGPARVMVADASGKDEAQENARVKVVNAGYSYVPGGIVQPTAKPTSVVQYSDDERREAAVQLALTLGLPETAVQKTEGEMLADVVVTLGQDYKPS
ncbi:LCP family protein [Yinghuangia sp. ASG 101]|uniref:LCP family protein n=1 Tax=Yinghuangia sp. ASG 101 TaxID=2896848 RepID=UPI001E31C40F|nr:LCP family protein [Yinghuangia sp. ASG 101]UGQ09815.1 LCP family protein [Yinghuangia sp. ASG 101]